jgi:hypothetical protein
MMSSWCQYEALKYVTFPTQVIFTVLEDKCYPFLELSGEFSLCISKTFE